MAGRQTLGLAVKLGVGGLVAATVALAVALALSLQGESSAPASPARSVASQLSATSTPTPSPLAQKVLLSEVKLIHNSQLFPQEGRGVVGIVQNRNDVAVRVAVTVILYSGPDVLHLTGGPYLVEAGETILVPVGVRQDIGVDGYKMEIASVAPADGQG